MEMRTFWQRELHWHRQKGGRFLILQYLLVSLALLFQFL